MDKVKEKDAIRYNLRQRGRLWSNAQIPIFIGIFDAGSSEFAQAVASFQRASQTGLVADGMLGPATLATLLLVDECERAATPEPTPEPEPTPRASSNSIVVGGELVQLPQEFIDAGVIATNYIEDGEVHFSARARSGDVRHLVIHESVTATKDTCVRVLEKRKLGVHLIIDERGNLSCHADLKSECPAHANQLNGTSVGCEMVNEYYPSNTKRAGAEVIGASWWTHTKKGLTRGYVTPTQRQMETAAMVIPWVCTLLDGLPLDFPTADLSSKKRRIKGWKDGAKPAPGIVAHRDFSSHADGRYVLESLLEMV